MRVARDDPEDKTAMFRIGPMWPEHDSTLMVWLFAYQLALQVTAAGHHLLFLAADGEAAEVSWLRAYLTSLDAAIAGVGHVLDLLGESPDSPLRPAAYAEARASVEAQLAGRPG
jgi:hypothetical protein